MKILDQENYVEIGAKDFVGQASMVVFPEFIKVRVIKKKYLEQMREIPHGHSLLKDGFKIVGISEKNVVILLKMGFS